MNWADLGWIVLSIAGFAIFVSVVVLVLTYAERKFIARMQQRIGPMRTGPWGLLQPVADALKLLAKEDLTPGATDKRIFWLAPLVVFVPGFVLWVTVPFTHRIVIQNLEFGIFYVIAVSSLATTGLVMAGWGSANKYALIGALRSAAQLISYELPLIVAVLGIVMIAGSMDLTVIVNGQHRVWYIVLQPLAFVIFFVASLAEVGRAPFDIPMAESEVVGGPFVEYSGMHWAMFFLAEYANTFALAVLATLLFLGGWHGWAPSHGVGQEVVQALWLLLKTSLVIMLVFWVRATVPRLRIDQLMSLAWKVLLPLAFVNFVLTAFYKFYGWPSWTIAVMSIAVLGAVLYAYHRRRFTRAARPVTIKLRVEHGRIVR